MRACRRAARVSSVPSGCFRLGRWVRPGGVSPVFVEVGVGADVVEESVDDARGLGEDPALGVNVAR
ncbi:hypothetical protein EHYA_08404 [Embleya hyalina]|uniref:Uncharacterized protein n=1 Tax=Embleya hyalina TaxID=516124 RepID=A0A401Z1F8_9ACTN|nr:hypothetical protein EHYA_08404 [Embleya hyalina]